jgi:hypothetical protein
VNYYDAQEIVRRHTQGLPINYGTYEEAKAFLDDQPSRSGSQRARTTIRPAPLAGLAFPPTMDTPCECGLRYGMHRVNDHACPNQQWRPGNGQSQWLSRNWKRA